MKLSKNKIITKLKKVDHLKIKKNVALSNYTTFKVGGPAEIFLVPESLKALQKTVEQIPKKTPFLVLGKGSNIIFSDRGYPGIIIHTEQLNNYEINKQQITAQAGITLSELAQKALDNSLGGLEFAAGIPGTLGGALYMNAGAYGKAIKNIISRARLINHRGETTVYTKEKLKLSYRSSLLQEKELIAATITLNLAKGQKKDIKAKIKKLNKKRREKQPLDYPSAGSVFMRPPDDYAGRLIEEAGLKGRQIGGARVSRKHAGFIINCGQATAQDIKDLVKEVQKEVYSFSKVKLKPEPRFIGHFD
ncbi:MAG: UDP-N-acetylmuramate dehydrogenase [Halanaerobiaceae bacterium]